ncbi:MAG: ParB N-terminal domain-containing protein [Christensenellales bacterium]
MKRRRQAAESQEKGVQAVRLRLADIYGGMISSRLKEDAALPVLAQSIARHGLLQPIVVQENEENGRYMLVCGARRLAACRLLGMTQIDAVQIPGRKPDAAACFLEDHFTRQTVPFLKEAVLLQRAEVAENVACRKGKSGGGLRCSNWMKRRRMRSAGQLVAGTGRTAAGCAEVKPRGSGGDHCRTKSVGRAGETAGFQIGKLRGAWQKTRRAPGDGRGAAPLRWVERAGAACEP